MNAVDRLKTCLQAEIDSAQRAVDNFIGKLQEDAAYALKWGETGFSYAAHVAVYKEVLAYLNNPKFDGNLQKLTTTVRESAMRMAGNPEFSTSPCSNLMHSYRTKSWVEVTGLLQAYATMQDGEAK